MKTYYKKSKSIKISWLSQKEFNKNSLCSRDYRELQTVNKNKGVLSDFIVSKATWKEIGSDSYMKKSQHRFLKTVNIWDGFLLYESRVEYCKPENKIFPKKGDVLIVKDGWGSWLWEVWYYNIDNENNYDSLSSGLIRVSLKKEKKFYILWLLKSNHFKTYIDLNTAQGSTIRHSKQVALDYEIPFPTKNNYGEPEKIEKLISLITQNLVDKEEQIKRKSEIIDEKIEKELRGNQKWEKVKYRFPRISEIKEVWRLDWGYYTKEIQEKINLVENYNNWFNKLEKFKIKYRSWKTPFFFDVKDKTKPIFLRPTEYNSKRVYEKLRYINDNGLTRVDSEEGIVIPRKWTTSFLYKEKGLKIIINDSIKFWIFENINIPFLFCYLSSKNNQIILNKVKTDVNWWALNWEQIDNLLIPNFPDWKQEEITKEYYNQVDKNSDLDFDNYLEKEKTRNEKLWIFQLNMELFSLREVLENLIDKIVMDKKIDVSFDY